MNAGRTISVITVAYNESRILDRLKKSLDRQIVPPGWCLELILVDNESTDSTRQVATTLGFSKVVGSPGTIAACRNAGFRVSTGEIVAYVDADCEPMDGWLSGVIDLMDAADKVVGWPTEPPHPPTWVQAAWHAHWTHKRGHVTDRVSGESAITLITTQNMSMTRSVMELTGGFDESLRSGEDMNLLLRAFCAGCMVEASPALRVVHHGEPRDLRAFYRQQKWHCSKSSFGKILGQKGGIKGGNALWFSLLFGAALALAVGVLIGSILLATPWMLLGAGPLLLLLIGPAMVIAAL